MLLVAFAIPSSPFRQPVTATTLQQQRRQLEEQQHLEISREHYLTASCDIPYNISISIWAVDSVDFVDSVSAFEGESNKYTNSRACQGRVMGSLKHTVSPQLPILVGLLLFMPCASTCDKCLQNVRCYWKVLSFAEMKWNDESFALRHQLHQQPPGRTVNASQRTRTVLVIDGLKSSRRQW